MREIHTYKRYFLDFYESQDDDVREKIDYALMLLKTQSRISTKFVKHIEEGVFELRAEIEMAKRIKKDYYENKE